MIGRVDWNAAGAIAGIGALAVTLLGLLARAVVNTLMAEVRKVTTQVTPPSSNGHADTTLGAVAVRVEEKLTNHIDDDDARFTRVWKQLGVPEPRH